MIVTRDCDATCLVWAAEYSMFVIGDSCALPELKFRNKFLCNDLDYIKVLIDYEKTS